MPRRSLGCQTCKKRKIKCDMRQPICYHCELSRRPCGGPASPFVLHSGMSTPRSQHCVQDTHSPAVSDTNLPNAHHSLRQQKEALFNATTDGDIPDQHSVSSDATETLSATLVKCLNHSKPGYRIQTFAPFIPLLPDRIGRSRTLDLAIESMLATHQDLVEDRTPTKASTERLGLFQKAIEALLDGVASIHNQAQLVDAVAAAILLATCEIYNTEHNGATWTSHIAGISAMISGWDPIQLDTAFELSLVATYAPMAIAKSLTAKKPCFLSSTAWTDALLRSSKDESTTVSTEVNSILAQLPGLFQRMSQCSMDESAKLRDISSDAQAAWLQLKTMQPDLPQHGPLSVRLPIDSLIDTSYSFHDPHEAQCFAMYWATLLIVLKLMEKLGQSSGVLEADAVVAIEHICKSVAYAYAIRPLECIYMTWCLPIAYVSVRRNDRMQDWLLTANNLIFAPLKYQYDSLHIRSVGEALTGGMSGSIEQAFRSEGRPPMVWLSELS